MEEENLIPEIIMGNTEAFTQLYNMYAPKAYRTALLICGNVHTAEDIVQETFIKCYSTLPKLKNPKAFPSYFYRTLTRIAWKMCNRYRKTLPLEECFTAESKAEEIYTELYNAIARLDTKMRTIIVLFYFNDMPIKEIAKATGTLEGTVKSRLYRARQELSKVLKREDYYG